MDLTGLSRAVTWGAKKAAGKVTNTFNEKLGDKLGGGLQEKYGDKFGKFLRRGEGNEQQEVTPYLGKWDNISQVWVNRWTILLFLVLARVLIASSGLSDNIMDAQKSVMKACLKLEEAGGVIASMPHYMSSGINAMTSQSIESTVHGVVKAAVLIITGIEQLLIFVLGLWKSTWLCLISALIQGAFDMAEKIVQGAADAAKAAVGGVVGLLEVSENALGGFIDAINRIPLVPDLPAEANFGDAIDKLKNLNIDVSDAIGSINDIQDKIPTYDELQNKTNEIISIPFNLAKKGINDSWGGFAFDRGMLPVAAKEDVAICSHDDRIPAFFAGLNNVVDTMRTIFIVCVVLAAVGFMLWFAWLEMRRWGRAQQTIDLANERAVDLFDAAWIAQHPFVARVGFWLGAKISDDPDKQVIIRYVVAYASTPTAVFVLVMAVTGILTCVLQYALLQVVKSEIPKLAADIGGMAAGVVSSLEATSEGWASDTNSVIVGFQDGLNEDLFGHIKTMTGATDDALQMFIDGINTGLNTAFGKTPFIGPLKTVVDCVILNKLENVQKGLRWVEEHAELSFPLLANDTFSIKNLANNSSDSRAFLNDPQAATNAEISDAVASVTKGLESSIITELLIAIVLFSVYVVIVCMAVGRAFWVHKNGIPVAHAGGLGGVGGVGAAGVGAGAFAGAAALGARYPPSDAVDDGHHWVEHQGREYMVGPDGEYVVGSDGDVVSRPLGAHAVGGRDGDGDGPRGSEESGRSDDSFGDGHAAAAGSVRPGEKADGVAGHHEYDSYARGEKSGWHDDDADRRVDNPFNDPRDTPPQYPSPAYRQPYAEDDNN